MEIKTHDTFVLGLKDGVIVFLKTYHYPTQKDEAQQDLAYVQNEDLFNGWFISQVGSWKLQHHGETETLPINIPLPKLC